MQIRDISVRKRLLFANFMMVFIPVCLLALLGAAAFAGLRFSGAAQQREVALFWPELVIRLPNREITDRRR